MTDETNESNRSSVPPTRKAVVDAVADEGSGRPAAVESGADWAGGGLLAASRRRVLAAAGLVGTGLASGCTDLVTGGPVTAEATPVILPSNHVRPTGELPELAVRTGGFRQRAWARRSRGTHSVDVAGRSIDVETENWGITYQRAMGCDDPRVREEFGCDSEFVLGETTLLSTPSVNVLGNQVNPIDDVSPGEVVDALGAGGRAADGTSERFATGEFGDPAELLRFSYGGDVNEVRNVQSRSDGWETTSGEQGSVEVSRFSLDVRLQSGQETSAEAGLAKTEHDGTIVLLASWGPTVAGASGGRGGPLLVSDPGDVGDSPPINLCGDCDCEDCCEEDNEYGPAYPCLCGCVSDNCLCDAAVAVGLPSGCPNEQCLGYVEDNVFGPVGDYNAAMREVAPEPLRFSGFEHTPVGEATLEVTEDDALAVSGPADAGEYGVRIDVGERQGFETELPLDPAEMPAGSYVESRFTGIRGGERGRSLGSVRLRSTPEGLAGLPDYSALGVDTYSVEIRDGDRTVGEASGLSDPVGFGAALAPTTFRCCCDMTGDTWEWYWRIDLGAVAFELPDGTVRGDRIDFTPDSSVGRLDAMTDVVMVASGVDGFRILAETGP